MKRLLRILVIAALTLTAAAAAAVHLLSQPMYSLGDGRTAASTRGAGCLPQGDLHCIITGTGDPVLVVHGGPGIAPARPWAAAPLLGETRTLWFYHQRGTGLSPRPVERDGGFRDVERQLGLAAHIADLEHLRRQTGRERVTLVGHSFGALIAALYAAEFPEHVEKLVLVSPANLVDSAAGHEDLFQLVGKALPSALKREYDEYVAAYFDFPALMARDERSLAAFFARFGRFYAAATGEPVAVDPALAGGFMPLGVYLSLGRTRDFSAALARVTAPVLVVHGERDLIPVAQSAAFARYFGGARLVTLPGAGHFPFEDQPAAFAAAVEEFL